MVEAHSPKMTDDSGGDARVVLFGTSRLHRPFARQQAGAPRLNYPADAEPVFMRVGYLHGVAEAAQVVEALVGARAIPRELLPFVFRTENKATTPRNEFDQTLATAIRKGMDFTVEEPTRIYQGQALIVEISSLRTNLHKGTGTVLHTNPNFLHDIAYPDIYPDGYYGKYVPWLDVDVVRETEESLVDGMRRIQAALPGVPLLIMGHLASDRNPQGDRLAQNQTVQAAAGRAGAQFIDVAQLVDAFGFAEVEGRTDYHHLSLEGEDALGLMLQREASRLV